MITKVQKWGNSQGLRLSKELLADVRIPDDYQPEDIDWGPPVGREIW
jgi:antitoxin component of MazEF toxin-antitoxin module